MRTRDQGYVLPLTACNSGAKEVPDMRQGRKQCRELRRGGEEHIDEPEMHDSRKRREVLDGVGMDEPQFPVSLEYVQ